MRCARGQASVDWIALVLVLAVTLLVAGAGALPGADAIPRAVGSTFARAFCLVSGGDCLSGRPRRCIVRSEQKSRERRVAAAVLRLADGRRVLREERSDGTVAITVEDTASGGAGVTPGLELTVGGQGVSGRAELVADARGAKGRRFVVPDAAAADRLMARLAGEHDGARRIVEGGGDGDPVPDERWWALGAGGEAEAVLSGLKVIGADARAAGGTVAGVRERPRTGERTVVLRNDSEIVAALTAPLSGLGVGHPSSAAVELVFDRKGEPTALTARLARGIHGELSLPGFRAGGGDLVEAEARLDLRDPVTRVLMIEVLDGMTDWAPRRTVAAARQLGGRLARDARLDVRLYETDRHSTVKGVRGGFMVMLGYEVEEITRTARLVDAAGREPGMGWSRRIDCVGIA
ncbi:MAG TPA: hypothetical protein VGW10_09445 [Solirubrobacteraceae bacterium]|nr:hypothetical protein [Solirubrobacteraceae bacterium]